MTSDKNLTFSITHGRTGTTFITNVFSLFDDIRSEHEPNPNFAPLFPKVKEDPRIAYKFWETKLEAISKHKEKNYVETSNVFGKGYFLPLIRAFDIYPNLLFITRDFRDTAKSLFKRGSIPARSRNGLMFSCYPSEQPGALPIFQHESLTDYQMCYWAVLDSFYRQLQAEQIYKQRELSNFVWLTANDLHDFEFFKKCGDVFGLEISDLEKVKKEHAKMSATTYNANPDRKVEELDDRDKQEAIVIDRVAYYNVLFAEKVIESKYTRKSVKEMFAS